MRARRLRAPLALGGRWSLTVRVACVLAAGSIVHPAEVLAGQPGGKRGSAGVAAATATEAKLRYARGRRLVEAGQFRAALDELFVSNRLAPHPSAAFLVAQCLELLGRLDDAFSAYEEYLSHDLTDVEREEGRLALARILGKVARLRVTSSPAGAAIFLDNETLGLYGRTPRTLAASRGEHRLIVKLAGFEPYTQMIHMKRTQELHVHAELIRRQGAVHVSSTPSRARVRLGGEDGPTLGWTPGDLSAPIGRALLHISREGYRPVTTEVSVEEAEPRRLDVVLPPLPPPTGQLRIVSNVSSALVELDGHKVGFSPMVLDVGEGPHGLMVSKDGFRSWTGTVAITRAETNAINVTLEAMLGRVRVIANVPSALVYVDGSETGFAPVVIPLSDGEHQLLVERPGYRPWRGTVASARQRTIVADVLLQPSTQQVGRGPWPWVLLGTTGAAGVSWLGVGLATLESQKDYERAPSNELLDHHHFMQKASNALMGITLGAAVITSAMFLFGEDRRERESSVAISHP